MPDDAPQPDATAPAAKPKRRYTVTPTVLAADPRNLEKANAVPKEIRYRRGELQTWPGDHEAAVASDRSERAQSRPAFSSVQIPPRVGQAEPPSWSGW
jgi:hypothetical protein